MFEAFCIGLKIEDGQARKPTAPSWPPQPSRVVVDCAVAARARCDRELRNPVLGVACRRAGGRAAARCLPTPQHGLPLLPALGTPRTASDNKPSPPPRRCSAPRLRQARPERTHCALRPAHPRTRAPSGGAARRLAGSPLAAAASRGGRVATCAAPSSPRGSLGVAQRRPERVMMRISGWGVGRGS